jgi:hypothetical protein
MSSENTNAEPEISDEALAAYIPEEESEDGTN